MSAEIDSWRTTLPCTRAEAEAIDAAADLALDAVLMTTETQEDDREQRGEEDRRHGPKRR